MEGVHTMQPSYEVSTMHFGEHDAHVHNTLVVRIYDRRLSLAVDAFAAFSGTTAVIAIAAQHYEEYWLQYPGDVRGTLEQEVERRLGTAAFLSESYSD